MTHLNKHDYEVKTCSLADLRGLVEAHHYAKGGSNTATFRHGLYHRERGLVGGAWWIPPTKTCALSVHPEWTRVLTLTRLVVAPEEPTNAASFLLGRSIRLIRQDGRFSALVTYSDERMGHLGQIYRATNWEYQGARSGDPVYLDTNGRQIARKAGGRTRTNQQMLDLGYLNTGRSRKHKFTMILKEASA